MNRDERCLWLIRALPDEMPQYRDTPVPALPEWRQLLLRSLMNVRPPMPATDEYLCVQDAYLRQMTAEKGIVDASLLPSTAKDERSILRQGDITTLRCDAVVNAANSRILGCFLPCRGCIDNATLHTITQEIQQASFCAMKSC